MTGPQSLLTVVDQLCYYIFILNRQTVFNNNYLTDNYICGAIYDFVGSLNLILAVA